MGYRPKKDDARKSVIRAPPGWDSINVSPFRLNAHKNRSFVAIGRRLPCDLILPREDALNRLTSNLDTIVQFAVDRIGLFGSLARSDANPESDIDALVRFSKSNKTFDNYMELRFHVDDLFERHSIGLVVEVPLKHRIKTSVQKKPVYAS